MTTYHEQSFWKTQTTPLIFVNDVLIFVQSPLCSAHNKNHKHTRATLMLCDLSFDWFLSVHSLSAIRSNHTSHFDKLNQTFIAIHYFRWFPFVFPVYIFPIVSDLLLFQNILFVVMPKILVSTQNGQPFVLWSILWCDVTKFCGQTRKNRSEVQMQPEHTLNDFNETTCCVSHTLHVNITISVTIDVRLTCFLRIRKRSLLHNDFCDQSEIRFVFFLLGQKIL